MNQNIKAIISFVSQSGLLAEKKEVSLYVERDFEETEKNLEKLAKKIEKTHAISGVIIHEIIYKNQIRKGD